MLTIDFTFTYYDTNLIQLYSKLFSINIYQILHPHFAVLPQLGGT